jgi:hypothetical protein
MTKIPFACPSCGFSGELAAAAAGKSVRCKHCGHRSIVPNELESDGDEYKLDEPVALAAGGLAPVTGSTFVPNPQDTIFRSPQPRRKTRKAVGSAVLSQKAGGGWWKWLVGVGAVIAFALVIVALVLPSGLLIAACAVILIGCVMLLAGYFAGAYGAFCEDLLYGLLYLLIPLYTAYYIITRWDDLWVWATCSTAGVGLILLGCEIARWAGVGAAVP